MKILLVAVNAKYIHSNLAVYSLKAYAEPSGCRKGAWAELTVKVTSGNRCSKRNAQKNNIFILNMQQADESIHLPSFYPHIPKCRQETS